MDDRQEWYRWARKRIRPDMELLREPLKKVLKDPGSPADALTQMWFFCEPQSGSDWTRDAELERWIAASERDPVAWEGCRLLLDRTGSPEHPVPPRLAQWGINVARRRISEPQLKQGEHKTDLTWRNARIAQAVEALRGSGCTLDEACEEVAKLINAPDMDSQTEMVLKVYKDARKDPKRYFANHFFPSF